MPAAAIPFLEQAVVISGHMVDQPDREAPRFPADAEPLVTKTMAAVFEGWGVGPGTLVVSGGARGADIIGAELGRQAGADVWLLVAQRDEEFVPGSVRLAGTDWEARYRALRRSCATRFQPDELGPAPSPEAAFERNNDWLLAVAQSAAPRLRAVAVWDQAPGDGPGGTADFVARARAMGATVAIVAPADGQLATAP